MTPINDNDMRFAHQIIKYLNNSVTLSDGEARIIDTIIRGESDDVIDATPTTTRRSRLMRSLAPKVRWTRR